MSTYLTTTTGSRACQLLILGSMLFCTGISKAAENQKLAPHTRIVTAREADLKTGAGIKQKLNPGEVVLVTEKNQEWLWVPLLGGWVRESDVRIPKDLVTYLDKAIKEKPTVERYQLRAIARQELKQYEAALADVEAALKLNPDNAHLFINRASIRRLQQETRLALEDLNHAIELAPHSEHAFQLRGMLYLEDHQPQYAIRDFDQAVKLNPRSVNALNARGIAHLEQGKQDLALKDFDQAIKLNNFVSQVFCNRAGVWQEMKQYGSAIKDYQRASELNPLSPIVHNDLAWLYATCEDPDHLNPEAAILHAKQACELTNNRDANMLDTLAIAYLKNEQVSQAVKTLEIAIQNADAANKSELQKKLANYKKKLEIVQDQQD
ncbi:lipoprotein NlpI [Gimesia panareensis]|uniref:Lipoprotein NlpI n=1 Tax=Gimesia panareensis TaxID=2527978 RepID=A0A517Q5H8_9PLAN|nr:tetratricopeptide repeat protein [Gimesia panareensis]QDT26881.1 lipoprotein NlpI [Gimesia panareensis]